VLFERGAKKLGLHPFPAPVAILSKPYKGRQACTHCGLCERFGCEVRAKSSTLAAMIPAALRTGRCQLRTLCYVRKIETNKAGRATGVIYFDARGREHRQRAKAVVVCANGAETPRLLLLSKSAQFPDGLANSSGQVGRNLMVDNGSAAMGLFPEQLNEFKGIQVTRALWDYYDADPNKRGFWGGGGLDARFDFYPISFALDGLPKDVPRYGNGFRSFLANAFTRSMMVLSHSTALPYEKHGFDLDPTVKDAWGLPALRMTYDSPPDDLATMRWLLARQVEILEAAGATKVWQFPVDPVSFTVHIMGTARMGDDKRRSVVTRDHQTHDVPNLFLVDGSSLVTSGRQQPTATIQALAFRAADKMAAHARVGNLGR
jgi:choline dehydrogenase-like flavoprotein